MPIEPERIQFDFPERAARWRKMCGYRDVSTQSHSLISTVSYQIPTRVPGAAGIRIAFISDFHFHATPQEERIAEAVQEAIRAFAPDYLCLGGDMTGYANTLDRLPGLLDRFAAIPAKRKLAISGNWESCKWWLPSRFWRDLYEKRGFHYLENEILDDGILSIFGTADLNSRHLAYPSWPRSERFRLTLAHNPDIIVALDNSRHTGDLADLALTGHTHGGQVRMPFFGAIHSSSGYGRRFDYGLYERSRSGKRMIISSGLGHLSFPFRFLCRREVVLVTLIPAL